MTTGRINQVARNGRGHARGLVGTRHTLAPRTPGIRHEAATTPEARGDDAHAMKRKRRLPSQPTTRRPSELSGGAVQERPGDERQDDPQTSLTGRRRERREAERTDNLLADRVRAWQAPTPASRRKSSLHSQGKPTLGGGNASDGRVETRSRRRCNEAKPTRGEPMRPRGGTDTGEATETTRPSHTPPKRAGRTRRLATRTRCAHRRKTAHRGTAPHSDHLAHKLRAPIGTRVGARLWPNKRPSSARNAASGSGGNAQPTPAATARVDRSEWCVMLPGTTPREEHGPAKQRLESAPTGRLDRSRCTHCSSPNY
jgi:hypothetical protein